MCSAANVDSLNVGAKIHGHLSCLRFSGFGYSILQVELDSRLPFDNCHCERTVNFAIIILTCSSAI